MKKILILTGLLLISVLPANAEIIKVQALSEFGTENPPAVIEVKAVSDMDLDDELLILDGYTLKGNLVDVVSPKRLKRDATFSLILTEYIDNEGQTHIISPDGKQFKGKFTTGIDYKHAAKSAALSVGNFFVKGLSLGYAAVEGAVKNEDGNRIKSSAHSVYESTPLSYVEKGEDILIAKDQIFCLRFKVKNIQKDENSEEINALEDENSNIQQETQKKELIEEETITTPEDNNTEEAENEDLSSLSMAPTPEEENQYSMTIEALQSEVLGIDNSKNDKLAFFGKKSDKESVSTDKSEIINTTEDKEEKPLQEPESKILPLTQAEETQPQTPQFGDDLRPVSDIKKQAKPEITPALKEDNLEIKDNDTTFEHPQKSKGLFTKPKFKNSTDSAATGAIGDPEETDKKDIFAETENQPSEKSDIEKGQKTKAPKGRELHILKEKPAPEQVETKELTPEIKNTQEQIPQERINPEISPAPQYETEQDNSQTKTETIQNTEVASPIVTVADKHLKRRNFNNYDSLVPELPAATTEPLAPLDLPDTY